MKAYDLSKFARRFDNEGYTAFFNGLTLKKTFSETPVMNTAIERLQKPYTRGENSSLDSLIDAGFFVEPGEDEKRFGQYRDQVGKINISNIVMIVDNRCNYACTYCQIEENMDDEQKSHTMSKDVARRALDLFEKNSARAPKRTVNLTGGEPLMNLGTVRYIVDRAQEMPNARTIIFTNGSLVTPESADYFAKAGTLMLVSLDGPREIHDSVRIRKGGKGTYEVSLRGYKLLKEAGCKVGISAVTGTHNQDRMDEVSEFFGSLQPPSIGLNFGHYLLDHPNPTEIGMGKFAGILAKFYETMREQEIFVENISRFISPFYQESPRLNECQAEGRGFAVDSRGKVGVCKSLLVSDIISKPLEEVSEEIAKEPIFQEWAQRSPFTLEECAGCQAIGICGGGCTYDSFAVNKGDIKKIDPRLCEYTDKILEFLVWDLFKDVKDKIKPGEIYIPTIQEQEEKFLKYYDPENPLQRSVGHEK